MTGLLYLLALVPLVLSQGDLPVEPTREVLTLMMVEPAVTSGQMSTVTLWLSITGAKPRSMGITAVGAARDTKTTRTQSAMMLPRDVCTTRRICASQITTLMSA